jgi:membrane protein
LAGSAIVLGDCSAGDMRWAKTVFVLRVLKKVYYDIARHDLAGQSAVLAYSHLFSLFPFLLCLSALMGIFGQREDIIPWIMVRIKNFFPETTHDFIRETFEGILSGYAPHAFTAGFITLIYLVSRTYMRLTKGLSIAFGSTKKRNIVWANVLGVIMAVISLAAVLVAFNLVAIGRRWMDRLLEAAHITGFWQFFGQYLRYPFAFLLIFLVVLLIYRVCPTKKVRIHDLWPGALLFNVIYGALGALMILMAWFYMSGFLLLLGGEVSAAIHEVRLERAAKRSE